MSSGSPLFLDVRNAKPAKYSKDRSDNAGGGRLALPPCQKGINKCITISPYSARPCCQQNASAYVLLDIMYVSLCAVAAFCAHCAQVFPPSSETSIVVFRLQNLGSGRLKDLRPGCGSHVSLIKLAFRDRQGGGRREQHQSRESRHRSVNPAERRPRNASRQI
jgi:hypothetical protein